MQRDTVWTVGWGGWWILGVSSRDAGSIRRFDSRHVRVVEKLRLSLRFWGNFGNFFEIFLDVPNRPFDDRVGDASSTRRRRTAQALSTGGSARFRSPMTVSIVNVCKGFPRFAEDASDSCPQVLGTSPSWFTTSRSVTNRVVDRSVEVAPESRPHDGDACNSSRDPFRWWTSVIRFRES